MQLTIKTRLLVASVALAGLSPTTSAQGTYLALGPGRATGISDDGSWVSGDNGNGVFRWSAALGQVSLGGQNVGFKMAADGSAITGNIPDPATGRQIAGLWTQTGAWQSLGMLPNTNPTGCPSLSSGYSLNADGTVAVGLGWDGCKGRAYRWTASTGMVDLGTLGTGSTRANAVSGDGQVVGGWDEASNGQRRAALWFPSGNEIILLPATPANPNSAGEVWDINSDGSVIVGQGFPNAFRWTTAGGVEDLGPLPGAVPGDIGTAWASSEDGSIIVGNSGSFFTGYNAFVWTVEDGMLRLDFYLAAQGITVPGSVTLGGAMDITPNGKYIVGWTGGLLADEAFRIELPAGVRYGFRGTETNTLRLVATGSASLGGTVTATTESVNSTATATILSARSARFPLLGGVSLIDLSGPVLVRNAAVSGGASTTNIPIPNDPRLIDLSFYMQSFALDVSRPSGLALSNGVKVTIWP